ncbi:unnamed protein product [Timema podura]|uniref:Uncharacterized protein n=1 Tax=Timema podura TaxID=61482 RepID=A0ABN7PAC3_TIMPD|nr:unnamed protein product [Timema podura]
MKLLRSSTISPESLVENIEKSIKSSVSNTHKVVTQKQIRHLAQRGADSDKFLAKYEELKSKNVDCLGSYISLLSKISEDKKLREFLDKNAKQPCSDSSLSKISACNSTQLSDTKEVDITPEELTAGARPPIAVFVNNQLRGWLALCALLVFPLAIAAKCTSYHKSRSFKNNISIIFEKEPNTHTFILLPRLE